MNKAMLSTQSHLTVGSSLEHSHTAFSKLCGDFKIVLQSVPVLVCILNHSKYEFPWEKLWQNHSLATLMKIKLIEVGELIGLCTKVYGRKSAVTG